MTEQANQQKKYYRPEAITRRDLETTIRVLDTLNAFQQNMHDSPAFQNPQRPTEFQSSLVPAIKTVKIFRDWWVHLVKTPDAPKPQQPGKKDN